MIHYHQDTRNSSFVEMTIALKELGFRDPFVPLTLLNPELAFVKPELLNNITDPDGSLREAVKIEAYSNIWYFFREIVRVPQSGGHPTNYVLTTQGFASIYAASHNKALLSISSRQRGASVTLWNIALWLSAREGWRSVHLMLISAQDRKYFQERITDILRNFWIDYMVSPSYSRIMFRTSYADKESFRSYLEKTAGNHFLGDNVLAYPNAMKSLFDIIRSRGSRRTSLILHTTVDEKSDAPEYQLVISELLRSKSEYGNRPDRICTPDRMNLLIDTPYTDVLVSDWR